MKCAVATILILDDDRVMVDLLRTVIEDAGHRVIAAADLEEVPRDATADLVVSDLLPLTDYRSEAARQWVGALRARFAAPVVVVTAHAAALGEPDRLGADAVVAKPFDIDALSATVRLLLGEDYIRNTP
jgi:DNA-binding response OmpR family regulator